MSHATAYVIETAQAAVGVVVRQSDGYRFYAATGDARPLEGRVFRTPAHAERAARRLQAERASATRRRAGTVEA
jgi:hypothetical protein